MFSIAHFFDEETRLRILEELRGASTTEATVYGTTTAIDTRVRRTKHIKVSPQTRALVMQQLEARKAEIERHFGIATNVIEEPQFLRYETGDFFVAHQDGNTPVIYDDSRARKISLVIFISERADYDGGALVLQGRYPDFDQRETAPAAGGTLVAFPAETTHEVTPLKRGERFTIVSWYRTL